MLILDRSGLLLYIHDNCRRRGQEGIDTEVPRCVPADSQGQLRAVAGGADPQLPGGSHPIPDRKVPAIGIFIF